MYSLARNLNRLGSLNIINNGTSAHFDKLNKCRGLFSPEKSVIIKGGKNIPLPPKKYYNTYYYYKYIKFIFWNVSINIY